MRSVIQPWRVIRAEGAGCIQEDTMAEQPSYQHRIPKTVINVLSLEPGTRVRLVGETIAEIVANPQDGVWLLLRYLAAPGNPDQVGTEDGLRRGRA